MANTSPIAPGTILDRKYEILSLLGIGGMGEVYKARHVHLSAFRCIKVMKANLLSDESSRARFLREARLATQVHHPNVAVVHDFEVLESGSSYIVNEFIDGTTLRQWSAGHGPFPLALAAEIAMQVLAGLDHIHRRGLLHRDISADNVMLAYDGDDRLVAKIIDLGVAKDTTTSSADTTQTGMLIGNPKYMSPEQLGELPDGEHLDGRTDLYSLGVVLYEMLAGVPPFVAKTPNGYIVKHLMQPPPPFRTVNPLLDVPAGIEQVILKALEKDRRNRHADARAFATALEPFLDRKLGTYSRADLANLEAAARMPLDTMATEVVSAERMSDDEAFRQAWEAGTPDAWRDFLATYDESGYVGQARELLRESEAFEGATGRGTETGLRDFLRSFPEGRHRLEAEIRLVDLKRKLEEEAWKRAVDSGTFVSMRDYLARFPSSSHVAEGQRVMADRLAAETEAALVAERAREEEAFRRAAEAKTAAAWQEFLDRFPSGARQSRAELNRREALAFEQSRDHGRAELEEFLRNHPDGSLTREARRIVARLADEDDLAHAESHDTAASWRLYLTAHPGGAGREKAQERLAALEDAAFTSLLSTKSARRAAEFMKDFPGSLRRAEVERLIATWLDGELVHQALDAIERGDGERAAELVPTITDSEARANVEAALETWRDRRAWQEAIGTGKVAPVQAYLDARPSGRWASEARKQLSRLRATADANEPQQWEAAWKAGTTAAWDEYLAEHASSWRAEEGRRCRIEAVEFESAAAMNNALMWRAFLKAWPEGRHRLDAEVRLRALS